MFSWVRAGSPALDHQDQVPEAGTGHSGSHGLDAVGGGAEGWIRHSRLA